MVHLNGNLLCAVDVETTGVIPGYHEVFQVAVLPLNANIEPLKSVPPFYINITPEFPERVDYRALKVTKFTLAQLINNSMEKFKAADLFDEWFEKLELPITNASHKKIMPLWSNGSFDKSFLVEWLGQEHYEHYFHFHQRDTQEFALSLNDKFYQHGEKIPFPKVGLNYLASCFEFENENAHDALADCVTTAEVYRRMLTMWTPCNPGAPRAVGPEVYYGKK